MSTITQRISDTLRREATKATMRMFTAPEEAAALHAASNTLCVAAMAVAGVPTIVSPGIALQSCLNGMAARVRVHISHAMNATDSEAAQVALGQAAGYAVAVEAIQEALAS
ncbi:MAG: hypothetical protein AAF791_12000 [Bacteroidota bacterium]